MSTSIHPYLIARLYAIQAAFSQPGVRSAMARLNSVAAATPPKNWEELLKTKEDDDKGEGGGGGTIKGLRGKHAEAAKAAMRRLGRR